MTEPVDRTDDTMPAKPAPSNALKWAFAIVAGLALAAVLVVGLNMSESTYMVEGDGDVVIDGETLQSEAPNDPPQRDEAQPLDPATTDPEAFQNQSYEQILETTVPILEDRRAQSLNQIDAYFRDAGKSGLPARDAIENPTPENMAAQDIERDIAADTFTITEIAQTNVAFAKNLARALYRDEGVYNKFVGEDLDGMKHATRASVIAVSPELPRGSKVGTYTATEPTLVLLTTDMNRTLPDDPNTHPIFNRVVSRFTFNGSDSHYAVVFQMQSDNSNFVDYPERLS